MLFLFFTAIIFGISTSNCYAQGEITDSKQLLAQAASGSVIALKQLLYDSQKDAQFDTARWALDRLEIRVAQEVGCDDDWQQAQKFKESIFSPTKIDKNERNFFKHLATISVQERAKQRDEAIEWAMLLLSSDYGQGFPDNETLLKKHNVLTRMQQRKIEKIMPVLEQEKPVLKHRNSFHKIYQFLKGRVSSRRNTI